MLHKKSFSTVVKNKNIWAKNLMKFQQLHKRGAVPSQEFSLKEKCRIPLKRQVVDTSFLELKSKDERKE